MSAIRTLMESRISQVPRIAIDDRATTLNPTRYILASDLPDLPKHSGEYDTGLVEDYQLERVPWDDSYVQCFERQDEFLREPEHHQNQCPPSMEHIAEVLDVRYRMVRVDGLQMSLRESSAMIAARRFILDWRNFAQECFYAQTNDKGYQHACRNGGSNE